MKEVIEKARAMRAEFYLKDESITGARMPLKFSTEKFSRFIEKERGISIDRVFLPPEEMDHLLGLYAKQRNGDVFILVSEENNECWRRFVFMKELCHVFLDEEDCKDVDGLAQALIYKGMRIDNENYAKEVSGVIAAIELLIPEHLQAYFGHEIYVKKTDSKTLASRLKVPQKFMDWRLQNWGMPIIHAHE